MTDAQAKIIARAIVETAFILAVVFAGIGGCVTAALL